MSDYTFDDFVAAAKKMQEMRKNTAHTIVYHPNDEGVLKSILEKDGWTVHSSHRASNGFSELTLHPLMRSGLRGEFIVLKGDETIVGTDMLLYKRERDNEKRTDDITRRYVRLPD